jgi:hypothetical protein
VSSSPAINPSRPDGAEPAATTATRWFKNPSYPARTHQAERAELDALVASCDEKIAAFRKKLGLLGDHPRRAEYETLFHQLRGSRDQIADAAARMPREAGHLYHEDHERLEFAKQAFARTLARWDAVAS